MIRRVLFPKEKNVGYVPQLIVKLQLRTTGSGLSEDAEDAIGIQAPSGDVPPSGGPGSIHRMLWLESVISFIFVLCFQIQEMKEFEFSSSQNLTSVDEHCLVQTKASSF